MAEEHTNNKVPELESNVGGEGAVETKDRGMFDFLGKKEEVGKPQEEVTIATEFKKVKIEEEEEHKEDHEKKHSLLEKLHRSDSSSSSSSDEEEDEGREKKQKKKKKDTTVPVEKCDEPVIVNPETPEKKGFIEKIKEKLPGQHNKAEEVTTPPASVAPIESVAVAEPHGGETKGKKGILEKIKEKLPGYHSKTDEEKEKEKEISASH